MQYIEVGTVLKVWSEDEVTAAEASKAKLCAPAQAGPEEVSGAETLFHKQPEEQKD